MSIYQEIGLRSIKPLASLDGVTNTGPTAGIWSGSGGTIVVELAGDKVGDTTTFTNVFPGTWLPLSIRRWVSGPVDAVLIVV